MKLCALVQQYLRRPIKNALKVTQAVKKLRKDITIIWGGWHTSLFPKQTLKDEIFIDVTAQGQGEDTFKELVEAYATIGDVSGIKGICYRNNEGQIVKNPPLVIVAIDTFADINYELIDVEKYFAKK